MTPPAVFSYCESVHAWGTSPWHTRKLTEQGRKLGGGIDTTSLCGLVARGWDLAVEIPKKRARHDCPRCRAVWEEMTRETEKTSSAPATRDPKEG